MSSHKLAEDENEARKFGLLHSNFPLYITETDIFACFESIFHSMAGRLIDRKDENKLKADLSHITNFYVNSFKLSTKDIKTHEVLKSLRKNNDFVVLKPDNGNGVVILNRSDYTEGILNIINDIHKFKELDSDPTIIREGKLEWFLLDRKRNGDIDKDIYSNIYRTGSQPARIYGLPKMHKIQSPTVIPPFRPIVSSLNTFNYQLAKYLCSLLQPLLSNTYSIFDTFSFVQELKTVDISNKFMVSFYVVSLFTNIPLKESIDLAVSYIAEGNPNFKLSKNDITKLFSFATSQTNFLFNDRMYDQIDDVAMSFPLAPVLANLFLGHHKNMWLNNYQSPSFHFYRRYVDDTFCLFNTGHDALLFFEFLNSQHPNIKFTMDKKVVGFS